ncbi:MAG: hypothetical protein AAGA54_16240 [Myxococcota bacterium]
MPEDAAVAWRDRTQLVAVADLCHESHFSVALQRCSACGQQFASVFSERIDWHGGNDPQSTLLLPVEDAEASALLSAGDDVEHVLHTLGPRKHLDAYFGSGPAHEVHWSDGAPLFMPHH